MPEGKRDFEGRMQTAPRRHATSAPRDEPRLRQHPMVVRARVALIVDDDPESTRLLTHCLTRAVDSLFARTIRQARSCIDSAGAIHLAFVAHDLPDGFGTQVLERLAQRHPSCARVLTSTWDRGALPQGPLDLAHIFLSKPLRPQLVKAIQRVAFGPRQLNI